MKMYLDTCIESDVKWETQDVSIRFTSHLSRLQKRKQEYAI